MLLPAGTACVLDRLPTAPGTDRIVVEAVLNPGASELVVFVNHLLTGKVDSTSPAPPALPTAVTDAAVTLTDADGTQATGQQEYALHDTTHIPLGVYVVRNAAPANATGATTDNALPFVPGHHYLLRVSLPDGREVLGTTTVPDSWPSKTRDVRAFDKARDTLRLAWSPVAGAWGYEILVKGPTGTRQDFTRDTTVAIAGTVEYYTPTGVQDVLLPESPAEVAIGAVDRNYYDYYRSLPNPLTGDTRIMHMTGGLGLFGSYVLLRLVVLDVSSSGTSARSVSPDIRSTSASSPARR